MGNDLAPEEVATVVRSRRVTHPVIASSLNQVDNAAPSTEALGSRSTWLCCPRGFKVFQPILVTSASDTSSTLNPAGWLPFAPAVAADFASFVSGAAI
jgi:hypothetical protein